MVARLFSSLPWLFSLFRREHLMTESSPAMRQTWTSYVCGDDFDLASSRVGGADGLLLLDYDSRAFFMALLTFSKP